MSLFHENIKQILSEVEKFIVETLKKEKLNKKAQEHKLLILDKLNKFFEENPAMKLDVNTSTDKEAQDDTSSMTGGSSKSDESEDTVYNEAGIAVIGASELKDALMSGYMEKKQKKGSGLFAIGGPKFQTRWCIIHDGIFYYYIKPEDTKQAGSFRLQGYKFRTAPDLSSKKTQKELCFELYQDDDDNKRIYQFMAKTKEEFYKWQEHIESGGQPPIEEDIYEEVGESLLNEPTTPKSTKEENVADGQADEEYEDPDSMPPKLPPPPTKAKDMPPPPPPPPEKSPAHKAKVPEPPEDLIQDDIYDEAMSAPAKNAEVPALPGRGNSVPVRPPEVPTGTKRPRPNRELPEPPPPKRKIKINITCKPEEDFENRYYGKWDCKGDNANELSFNKGEIIHIISKDFDDKSWWVGELNGNFGLVPKTFLTPAFISVP